MTVYADPGFQKDGKERYPIDTEEHVRAALSYIEVADNAAHYSAEHLATVKDNIRSAAKKLGIKVADDNDGDESKSSEPDGAVHEDTPSEVRESDDAAPEGTSSERDTNNTRKAVPMAKTIDELRARLDEISERMQELGGDETRSLDNDEQTEWDGLDTEYVEISTSIKNIEKRAERLKVLANGGAVEETVVPKPATRRSATGAPAFHKERGEDMFDLDEVRAMSYSGGDFLNKVRDNAMRAVEKAKYAVPHGTKEDAQSVAANYLETIDSEDRLLAKRFLLTGSKDYESAFGKVVRYGNDATCTPEERMALARAQALGTDASGGYAVPFQLDPTVILTNAGVTNPIRSVARQVQIVGKQWQGVTSAGVTVSRGAEGAVAPDNTFTLAQPVLSTNRVQGFVPFNIEIDLAWNALRSEITRVLVDGKSREEDSFITGDGSTGQQPGGVVGSLVGNTVAAGGTASFAAADVYALQTALDPRWEAGSTFLAHKAIYHKVRQFDTAGGAQLWARIGEGRPNELLAYPAMAASAMDSTLTTGKKILLYGDFSQFLIVDRIGMSVETVPHLFDTATGRPTGQRGVYAVWMNNSKILVHSAFKQLVTS